jgi:hypothetical protein
MKATTDIVTEEQREEETKQKRLKSFEESLVAEASAPTDPTFVQRLVASVVNNIQVNSELVNHDDASIEKNTQH